MAQADDAVTLEDVFRLAKQLSPVDQVRLIERVAPEIERELSGEHGDIAAPVSPTARRKAMREQYLPKNDAPATERQAWRRISRAAAERRHAQRG